MSDLISHEVRHPGDEPGRGESAEAAGRRALGIDALRCGAVGAAAVLAGGAIGRQVDLPAPVVRGAGAATLTWAAVVLTGSVAESWVQPARRAVAVNAAATAALVGHAVVRGRRGGRWGVLVLAGSSAAMAGVQARALVAAEPHPGASASR